MKNRTRRFGNFASSFSLQVGLRQIILATAEPVAVNQKQECRMPTSKATAMKKPTAQVIAMPTPMPTAPMPSAARLATVIPMPLKATPAKHSVKKAAAKKARKIVAKKTNARKKATAKKFAAAAAKKPARKAGPRMKK